MRKLWWMGPLREAATGSDGVTGGGGGGTTPPAFDATKFVSADDFGKTAAKIRGIESGLTEFQKKAVTVDVLIEAGLLEKTDDGKYRKPGAASATEKGTPNPQLDALTKQIDALTKQNQAKDAELATERERIALDAKAGAVKAALTKFKAVKPERDYVHLLTKVTLKDGVYVVPGKDQYGNEIVTPLDTFVEAFMAENPELQQPQSQAGSGTPSTPGGGGSKMGGKVIPKETWSDMAWYAKNADKFRSGEFTRGY